MDTNCSTQPCFENAFLDRIAIGRVITPGELRRFDQEATCSLPWFLDELTRRFEDIDDQHHISFREPPLGIIADETFFLLVSYDATFMGNPFFVEKIRCWQFRSAIANDPDARKSLRKIGICLSHSRARGQRAKMPPRDIARLYKVWHARIRAFQKAFRNFKPGSVHANRRERARSLLRLSRLKMQVRLSTGDARSKALKELESVAQTLQADLSYIEADFVSCNEHWCNGRASDLAYVTVSEYLSKSVPPCGKPVSKWAVQAIVKQVRKKDGQT